MVSGAMPMGRSLRVENLCVQQWYLGGELCPVVKWRGQDAAVNHQGFMGIRNQQFHSWKRMVDDGAPGVHGELTHSQIVGGSSFTGQWLRGQELPAVATDQMVVTLGSDIVGDSLC